MVRESPDEARVTALVELLKVIRQGRGFGERGRRIEVSPELWAPLACDEVIDDNSADDLEELLIAASTTLSDADGRLVRMALNVDRVETDWLSRANAFAETELGGVSEKTVVRRVDAAFRRLAVALVTAAEDEEHADGVVSLASLRAMFRRRRDLDSLRHEITVRCHPTHDEVLETREVRAVRDGVQYYVIGKGLPGENTEVRSATWEGAELLEVEQPNEHYLLELLRFPEPLERGRQHRFVVRHEAVRMAPLMTVTPVYRQPEYTVRLQYVDQDAGRVWALDGVSPYAIRTRDLSSMMERVGRTLTLDRLGFVEETFTDLRPAFTYGLVWDRR